MVKTRECRAPRVRQTTSFDSWSVAKLSDSKTIQTKNIENNYLEYLFAQQNATNNNRKTVHNDHFFRNKSKQKTSRTEEKTQTEQTGKWFFKEIVHERINQTFRMKERKKNRHTYTKKTRMQRENKRTGETLSKNKTKTSNKRIKQNK